MLSRSENNKTRERNQPPPLSSFSQRSIADEKLPRKVRHVTCAADYEQLEQHYSFLLDESSLTNTTSTVGRTRKTGTTYQDRMVQYYHSHLYKEFVLADLTTRPGQVGLRWRTRDEVERGKGQTTCGNKHCPSYHSLHHQQQQQQQQQKTCDQKLDATTTLRDYYQKIKDSKEIITEEEEQGLLEKVPHGLGLHDYEVPFSYQEHGTQKTELVKLCLCLRCAPLLFQKKEGEPCDCALEARRARTSFEQQGHPLDQPSRSNTSQQMKRGSSSDSCCTSSSSDYEKRRRRKRRKKRRTKKRKNEEI